MIEVEEVGPHRIALATRASPRGLRLPVAQAGKPAASSTRAPRRALAAALLCAARVLQVVREALLGLGRRRAAPCGPRPAEQVGHAACEQRAQQRRVGRVSARGRLRLLRLPPAACRGPRRLLPVRASPRHCYATRPPWQGIPWTSPQSLTGKMSRDAFDLQIKVSVCLARAVLARGWRIRTGWPCCGRCAAAQGRRTALPRREPDGGLGLAGSFTAQLGSARMFGAPSSFTALTPPCLLFLHPTPPHPTPPYSNPLCSPLPTSPRLG